MLNITLEPQLETIRFVPQLTVIIGVIATIKHFVANEQVRHEEYS